MVLPPLNARSVLNLLRPTFKNRLKSCWFRFFGVRNARNGMEEIPDSEFSGAFKHDEMFLQSQETPQTPHRSNSSGGSTAGSGSSASKRMGRGRASGGRGIIIDSGVRRPGATTTPVSSERLGDNHGRSPLRGLGRGMGSAVAS